MGALAGRLQHNSEASAETLGEHRAGSDESQATSAEKSSSSGFSCASRNRQSKRRRRRDSMEDFAQQSETIIVFDWDDTLFPSSFLKDRGLQQNRPPSSQNLAEAVLLEVEERLAECQAQVVQVLRQACQIGHPVILTLAKPGWVQMACDNYFPLVGDLLEEMRIPVIYALEQGDQRRYDESTFENSLEQQKFWGMVKGRAMVEQVDKFYSQYPGQSWKNILSIGDSQFERFGLLAAASAYVRGESLDHFDVSLFTNAYNEKFCRVENGKVKELRAKTMKLIDSPEIDELVSELDVVSRWLNSMVSLDSGFDLDISVLIEDEGHLSTIEKVLRGALPATSLPTRPQVR